MDDDLCGTYWACVSGTPMPVCCPEGMRYNKASRICEESSRLNPCMDPCPDGYTLGMYRFPCKHMGCVATKPVFRVSDKASFKPVSSATETS